MSALWIHELAAVFWANAGGPPPVFPRDLGDAATWALHLSLHEFPNLSVASVNAWLTNHNVEARLAVRDRPLRACLVAHGGSGFLFVDASDHAEERRFSQAHEIAHYLVECAAPRDRARGRLGESILPVLDGHRLPTLDERIGALLGGVSLAPRLHLMERTPDGHPSGHHVSNAERRADELAFELLAPFDAVRACLPEASSPLEVEALLCQRFGLPPAPARIYARQLALKPSTDSLLRALFRVS